MNIFRTHNLINSSKKGFSLIELMVSMALFAFVSVAMVGITLSIIDGNRKSQAMVRSMDSLNFVLESISRELRVGSNYNCNSNPVRGSTSDCNKGEVLGFISSEREHIIYKFDSVAGEIQRCKVASPGSCVGGVFIPMTGSNVKITNLAFYVQGSSNSDTDQPRVTIAVHGTSGDGKISASFNIQTTITQRFPDF